MAVSAYERQIVVKGVLQFDDGAVALVIEAQSFRDFAKCVRNSR
jgi:hypothetical protein